MNEQNKALVPAGQNYSPMALTNWISPTSLEQALTLAKMMADAKLLPAHLQGDTGSCLLVLEQASRWGMSPFAVAQCTSVVYGRLCFEGKLVAAALSAMRAIEGRLEFDIQGTGQDAKITVTGTPRGAKKPASLTGSVKQWRTYGKDKQGNPMKNAWDTMPEDMLVYRGTRQWARRYAPEAILGVFTPDEFEDSTVIDVTPPKQPDQFTDALRTGTTVENGTAENAQAGQEGTQAPPEGKNTGATPDDLSDANIEKLLVEAGLGGTEKTTLRENFLKSAAKMKPRAEWSEDDRRIVVASLRELIERNAKRQPAKK